jgi:hypothetical protein
MAIMHIIAIISIISDCFLIGWLESVGSRVVYELDYKKPILYVIPMQSILSKLPLVLVGDTGTIPHSMRNAFSGAPGDWTATRGRAQAMDAGCASSTRGHWDGPVNCNESHEMAALEPAGQKVPCEHDASACLGHATVCSGGALTILIGSLSSASAQGKHSAKYAAL